MYKEFDPDFQQNLFKCGDFHYFNLKEFNAQLDI